MGVYRRGGIWWIDYYFDGQRVRERVGPNKRDAQDALAQRRSEIRQGRFEWIYEKDSPLFEEFAETYYENHCKVNKRSWERDRGSLKSLVRFFRGMRLCDISPFLVEKYKAQRGERVKPATVNRDLSLLKHMFNTAIRWGEAKENPAQTVKKLREDNHRERILSPEEVERLLECSEGHKCHHLRPILVVALNTGMRLGEILNLRWDDVEWSSGSVKVVYSKSGKMRKIPMNQAVRETLKELEKGRSNEYVFAGPDGKPYGSVKRAFKNALRKAGIEGCRFHDLRHTFASHLVMNGVDLVTVKELLGHSTIEMTMRYSHTTNLSKRSAVAVLNDVLKKNGHNLVTIGKNG